MDKKKAIAIVKFLFLIGIIVGIPAYIYFFHKNLIMKLSNLEQIKVYFENNKASMSVIYIFLQALQIIISVIPGQWLQIGAGFFYGVGISYILSIIGALIGSVVTYFIADKLGKDALYVFFKKEQIDELIEKLNSKRALIIIFLIFLIPGVPKDLCNYVAGISNIKLKPFLVVSLLGRSPGMLGSILIGKHLYTKSYIGAIIVGVVATVFFILGVVYRKKINTYLDGLYDKYMEVEE